MTLTPLLRADFLSQAARSASTYQLATAQDARTFVEHEVDVFARTHGLSEIDRAELRRSIRDEWMTRATDPSEGFSSHLADAALEAIAWHTGHKGNFEKLRRTTVDHVALAAQDLEGWNATLLELCATHGLNIDMRAPLPSSRPVPEDLEVDKAHAGLDLPIAVRMTDDGHVVDLPADQWRIAYRAHRFDDVPQGRMLLTFHTGGAMASIAHMCEYEKSGDTWVPRSTKDGFPSYGPGTLEHRAFEALYAAAPTRGPAAR